MLSQSFLRRICQILIKKNRLNIDWLDYFATMGNGKSAPSVSQLQETPATTRKASDLNELNVCQMRLTDAQIDSVIESLNAAKYNRVDVSDNRFSANGIRKLVPHLIAGQVRHLGLAGNPLRLEGLEVVAELLGKSSICVLSLHGTGLTENDLMESKVLNEVIKAKPELPLRWLDMSYNPLDRGIVNLATALSFAHNLTSIYLNGTMHPANPRVRFSLCDFKSQHNYIIFLFSID